MDYNLLMKDAREYVKYSCSIGPETCSGSPGCILMGFITTAMSAIQSGITTENYQTIAKGQAVLEEAVEILRNCMTETV